jgi:hypothetical protein
MKLPLKIETLYVDDGVTAFAASRDGQLIAIGTTGMVGIYAVSQKGYIRHTGSFALPHDRTRVTHIAFSRSSRSLIIRSEDGEMRELSITQKENGFLREMRRSAVDSVQPIACL